MLNFKDILSTQDMIDKRHLDIRTITMGISLLDCTHEDVNVCATRIYDKITRQAEHLVQVGQDIEWEFGIPIVNKRISVTPIAIVGNTCNTDSVGLRMHIASHNGLVVQALHYLQISAMHIDGIVHHSLVESIDRAYLTLATREVGGIGLCRKIAGVIIAPEAYTEAIEVDILAHLGQQPHALGIVHLNIMATIFDLKSLINFIS